MTIERRFHCDGPECEHHGSDQFPGWIQVRDGIDSEMQFCSWDCLLKFAAKFPPPERIEMGGES